MFLEGKPIKLGSDELKTSVAGHSMGVSARIGAPESGQYHRISAKPWLTFCQRRRSRQLYVRSQEVHKEKSEDGSRHPFSPRRSPRSHAVTFIPGRRTFETAKLRR